MKTVRLRFAGQVQGVGFRPFVYRCANELNLHGQVHNSGDTVELTLEGNVDSIQQCIDKLLQQHPPLASPELITYDVIEPLNFNQFEILDSTSSDVSIQHVPSDYAVCDDCLAELNNPDNRRCHYPFINCTQCGPRYTLIKQLPYDRKNTTMSAFIQCTQCANEYNDVNNRRYHAEPNACPVCGPQLCFSNDQLDINDNHKALTLCVDALNHGDIIAIKGIGGYHLMCDATNHQAIESLRQRKQRPDKPLAVMFPYTKDHTELLQYVKADDDVIDTLNHHSRPIVLINKKPSSVLAKNIAPGLNEIGCLYPYSPLHHLLLQQFSKPLVATSGNISGEPVLIDNEQASKRLSHIADAFLHHNRDIQRPADDSVLRPIAGRARPIRLGRGLSPTELMLPFQLEKPVLALGGHMKNSVALAWQNRVVISAHIGELDSPHSLAVFQQVIDDLQRLYHIKAEQLIHDAHPQYASTRWANSSDLPGHAVFHHHAHASVVAGEYPQHQHWLVFTWDGVGYGDDTNAWGGEALLGGPGHWRHVGSIKPFHLPGGDKAGREPWRSAAALCWETDNDWPTCSDPDGLAHQAWKKKFNCTLSTAVGRLFDAAAALTGLLHSASFESHGPMLFEALARPGDDGIELAVEQDKHGLWRIDWSALMPVLLDHTLSRSKRASVFHETLAAALVTQAIRIREQHGEFVVGLSGGVFQNKVLTESVLWRLQQHGFDAYLPVRVPVNDAGLGYGQVIEWLYKQNRSV